MQFLSENCLNGRQIFGRFGFSKTESESNFGFPHIPSDTAKLRLLQACDSWCSGVHTVAQQSNNARLVTIKNF